jgi:hypothetical protein
MKKLSKQRQTVLDMAAKREAELLQRVCQTENLCGTNDPLTCRYRDSWWKVKRLHTDLLDELGMP